jgi:hypothetical protein
MPMMIPGHMKYSPTVNGDADTVVSISDIPFIACFPNVPFQVCKLTPGQNDRAILTIESNVLFITESG